MKKKRILVWILAILIGIVGGIAITIGFQATIEQYGIVNGVLAAVGIGALSWIWLDKWFKTGMIPL